MNELDIQIIVAAAIWATFTIVIYKAITKELDKEDNNHEE